MVIFNRTTSAGVDTGPSLLLFSLDGFYNLGLVFGREDADKDEDGNNLQERDEGKGTTMTTMTTTAWQN